MYDVVTNSSQLLAAQPKPMLLIDSSQSAPSQLIETAETPLRLVDSSQPVAKANVDSGTKHLSLVESMVANRKPLSFTDPSHLGPDRFLEDYQKPSLPIDFGHSASQDSRSNIPSLDVRRSSGMVLKECVTTWYNGYFGTVTVVKKSKYTGSSLQTRTADAKSMFEETVIFLRPSFWKRYYELRSRESLGSISRTLNVELVVDNRNPVFQMCRSGDITGLLDAFRCGKASPYMVNRYGMGLLHVKNPLRCLLSLRLLTHCSMRHVTIN